MSCLAKKEKIFDEKETKKAIKTIKKFYKSFSKFKNVNFPRRDLFGEIGEFYVQSELGNKFKVVPKGGQSGCDIFLPEIGKGIEVRTSTFKEEGFSNKISYWGWRLKNKGKPIKYDYVVLVALDGLLNPRYFILSKKEVEKIKDTYVKRFKAVQKRLTLFVDWKDFLEAKKSSVKFLTNADRKFNKNPKIYENRWGKIK